jgi:diphthamide synthase subunit DPH2
MLMFSIIFCFYHKYFITRLYYMTVNNYTIGMAEELLVIGETRKKVGSKDRIAYVVHTQFYPLWLSMST